MRYQFVKCGRQVYVLSLAVMLASGITLPAPAQAQSFFEMLFGSSKPAPPPAAPVYGGPARLLPPGADPGFGIRPPSGGSSRPPLPASDDDDPAAGRTVKGATYRTLCVRLCDGYFWPISFATTRNRFYRDATTCKSSCGAEAVLFFVANPGGQIDDAVDQTGRAYARLTTAFRYRKSLVAGCACRPEPWSESEMIRHERYALVEQAAGAKPADARATPTESSDASAPPSPETPSERARSAIGDPTMAQSAASGPEAASALAPLADEALAADKPHRRVRIESARARALPAVGVPPRPARPVYVQQLPPAAPAWGGSQQRMIWPGDAPARYR